VRILAKLGGTLLDEAESRTRLARQLAQVAGAHTLAVVHGGGKQLTRHLAERGVNSRFVNGLRVSDEAVIDAATQVIAGRVNKQLVGAMASAGQPAIGLSGVDGGLTLAEQISADLQFVGSPIRSNGALLRLLSEGGYLPVIACLAADEQGQLLNVNADQMAVSCASAFQADLLLFLTDVPGVKDAAGRVVPRLTPDGMRQLIETGVAHGGMQAKLDAAARALHDGVAAVMIVDGREEDVCARVLAGEPLGTRLQAI